MNINSINSVNCGNPPLIQNRGNVSCPYFSAAPKTTSSNEKSLNKKVLWGTVAIGSAIALALIGKKQIKSFKFQMDVKKNYNNIWQGILKSFDSSKNKIQIKKPELKLISGKNNQDLGQYIVDKNEIGINLDWYMTDKYISYNKQKDCFSAINSRVLFSKEEIEKFKRNGYIDDTWTIQKLTDKEKMLAIVSTLVHEQRHCVQNHIILNDIDYGPEYLLKELAKKQRKLKPGLSEEESIKKAKENCTYLANFNSKGGFKNLELPSTVIYKNQRISFTAKELADATFNYASDGKQYDFNLLEVDANSFALAYLNGHPELQKGCSKEVVSMILRAGKLQSMKNFTGYMDSNKKIAV